MKSVYFVRHGQTLFNSLNKVQGISDTPLTEEGLRKAKELGGLFRNSEITFDAAYTSDLGRARKTSELLLAHSASSGIPLIETTDLREISFGMFEGDPGDDMWERIGKASGIPDLTNDSLDENKIPVLATMKKLDTTGLAESYEDVKKRIEHILGVFAHSEASSILAVSHGLFINSLVYTLSEKGTHLPIIINTSVTKLIFENGIFRIDYIGHTDHL